MKDKTIALLGIALSGVACAGTSAPPAAPPVTDVSGPSLCDLLAFGQLYKNPDNPLLQSLAFTGRLQVDGAIFDGDELGDYDALLWRRVRGGFKAKVLNDFTLHVEADFDFSSTDVDYSKLTDANIAWSRGPELVIKAGKQGAEFTLDGGTSSKKLITIDRSNLANNMWFTNEYFTGLSASGEVGAWNYFVGAYSADGTDEFGDFDSGEFYVVKLGRDFSDAVGLDKAAVRLDYMHADLDFSSMDVGTRNLEQVISLSTQWEDGDWGLWTDLAWAQGYEVKSQSDLFGLQLMPFYNFTDKVQGVFRYTHVESDEDNGVRLARYENAIESGRGDSYDEFYVGLNYYICDHNLKVQTGVQYANLDDAANDGGEYDGWGWTTGLRFYW